MKSIVMSLIVLASTTVFAFDMPNIGSSLDQLMENSTKAVQEYAVSEVGMSASSVSVVYDYSADYFVVSDGSCSFKANAVVNFAKLGWKVKEVSGSNTCH